MITLQVFNFPLVFSSHQNRRARSLLISQTTPRRRQCGIRRAYPEVCIIYIYVYTCIRARCVWIRRIHHEMLCIQYVLNCVENMRATEEKTVQKYIHACDVYVYIYIYVSVAFCRHRKPVVIVNKPSRINSLSV